MPDLYEQKLNSSDLTLEDAKYLGLQLLTPQETQEFLSSAPPNPSILIPYYDISGNRRAGRNDRIRLLGPPKGFYKAAKKLPRFLQQPGAIPQVYFPRHPHVNWIKVLNSSTKEPIYITEGELKAACAVKHGLPCVSIGGVWSWMSKDFDMYPIPDFKALNLRKRIVYLIFDADQTTNANVREALRRFSECLVYLYGARVHIVDLPEIENYPNTGIDDFILHHGFPAFKEHVANQARPYITVQYLDRLGKHLIVVKDKDWVLDRRCFTIRKFRDAKDAYVLPEMLTPTTRDKFKTVSTYSKWFRWEGRTTVKSLCFKPDKEPRAIIGDQFNLWTGFNTEPLQGSVEPWHSFLNHLIPDQDDRLWVERWIAWRFQHPHLKPFTALCLYSTTQGTGKTFLTRILQAIVGEEHFSEIEPEDFKKQFNKLLERKLFIFVEEAYNFGDPNYSTKLKNAVTKKTVNIELKGKDAYPLPDLNAWIFTSNHADALYLDSNDRRFYVVEVTDKRFLLKKADEIEVWFKSPEGGGALLHYFQTMDLQGFDAREPAPMTMAKHEMITTRQDPLEGWVKSLAQGDINERFDGCILRTLRELLAMFRLEWQNVEDGRYTTRRLARILSDAGYKKVNRHSKKNPNKQPNIHFQIGSVKTDSFWLMDRSQHHFYEMDHGELVDYLRTHHKREMKAAPLY